MKELAYPIAILAIFSIGVTAGKRQARVGEPETVHYIADSILSLTIEAERDTIVALQAQLAACRKDIIRLVTRDR
jgi:hypothetical protein